MQIVIIGSETFIEFASQQEADAALIIGDAEEIDLEAQAQYCHEDQGCEHEPDLDVPYASCQVSDDQIPF